MDDFDKYLLCEEQESCLNKDPDGEKLFEECKDEDIEMLIQKEYNHVVEFPGAQLSIWFVQARVNAIDWILSRREHFGFQFQTAYLSVLYLDKFLAKRTLYEEQIWAMRLLTLGCLSIAAKMEETVVPPLLGFLVEDDYHFQSSTIRRMEILILATLDWKLNLTTPFPYLHYFIDKFHFQSKVNELFPKIVEIISDIPKEINVTAFRPSMIAAAAVLASHDEKLTRIEMEGKTSVIPSMVHVDNEQIYTCYHAMQEMKREKMNRTPKGDIAPRPRGATRETFFSRGTKRSLSFNDYFISKSDKRERRM